MTTTLPYGSWPSPISARLLAGGGVALGGAQFAGDAVYWTEGIAAEQGRIAVVRASGPAGDAAGAGEPVTVLPAPWSARSRVHEYGGGSFTVVDGVLLFVNFADQRVYALPDTGAAPGPGEEPRPLTPVGPDVESAHGPSLRWACPTPVTLADGTAEVWWVCEDHTADRNGPDGAPLVERYVAAVPLDGSAADDPAAVRRVTPAARFVAFPQVSPDGARMAWISWEHPQMPWDGTELHVAPLTDGAVAAGDDTVVTGDTETSVLEPAWLDADRLVYLSDESGWWNPYVWSVADGSRPVLPAGAETARQEWSGAMWMIGTRTYEILDAGHLLALHGTATRSLGVVDVATGTVLDVDTSTDGHAALTDMDAVTVRPDGLVAVLGASPTDVTGLRLGRLTGVADGRPRLTDTRVLRSSRTDVPDPSVLPTPHPITVPLDAEAGKAGGVVHAIWYPPYQEGYAGPEGELPPVIAYVHGGPTSQTATALELSVAYYTSRGLGFVDVNYGGSTGFGREYRDRLKGQWGVVDVTDTVAVMEHLVREGLADPRRLAIEGGSAGGWTTLACLTRTDTFAAGVSRYGVSELESFVADTHDFESRYVDSLVGPYPEQRELYVERAPLSHVDELSCPVLLLQGDEDRIVPPSQSEMVRDALAAKHIPHAYLVFEGEQHGFRKADSIVRATEASLSFYGQVFGFTPDVPALELTTG